MHAWADHFLTLISTHRQWGPVLIGLVTLVSSLAGLGAIPPATVLLVGAGGLVQSGLLDPIASYGCGIGGAHLGYWLSYVLGRHVGPPILQSGWLKRRRRPLARSRMLLHRYGGLAVLLSRAFGPLRATVPLLAGVMGTDRRVFALANLASAILWTAGLMAFGHAAAAWAAPLLR